MDHGNGEEGFTDGNHGTIIDHVDDAYQFNEAKYRTSGEQNSDSRGNRDRNIRDSAAEAQILDGSRNVVDAYFQKPPEEHISTD